MTSPLGWKTPYRMTMGKVSLLFSIVRYCLIASEKNLNSLGALFRNDYSSGGELLFLFL